VVGVPAWAALTIGIAIIYALRRVSLTKAMKMAYNGVRWDLTAAVASMLFFRYVVLTSGTVDSLLRNITVFGVPSIIILTLIPFVVGSMSGTPTMGVGIVFPLLIPLIEANIHFVSVVYAGIICGYLASPMHLCLVLTNNYYQSELGNVYKYLVPSTLLLYACNLLYHLSANGLTTL
jgi:hypothetical protein